MDSYWHEHGECKQNPIPNWGYAMAMNRGACDGVAIAETTQSGNVVYLFMFASQGAGVYAMFMELRPYLASRPIYASDEAARRQLLEGLFLHEFTTPDPVVFLQECDLPFEEDHDLYALPGYQQGPCTALQGPLPEFEPASANGRPRTGDFASTLCRTAMQTKHRSPFSQHQWIPQQKDQNRGECRSKQHRNCDCANQNCTRICHDVTRGD